VSSTEWGPWWKKTRDLAAGDGRIDSRRAFQELYALPKIEVGDEEELELPPIDEPKGIDHNLNVIHGFLDHHPGAEGRLKEALLERVRKWADRKSAKPSERARARLLLARWDEAGKEEHAAGIQEAFREGFDLSDAGSAEEQIALLELGLEAPSRVDAMKLGLNTRNAAVRDRAIDALWSTSGLDPVRVLGEVLAEPTKNIEALFEAIGRLADPPAGSDPRWEELLWPAVLGLIEILNTTGREPLRKKGLKLLDPGGLLVARMQEAPPDERTQLQITSRLREWRASDKVLFPILEAFEEAGLALIVESVKAKRAAAYAKLFEGQPALDDVQAGPVIMTRHTFNKLSAELERVNLELKTAIPQAIRKARELGDLRENAEYEAAKLKQAQYSKRLAQLDAQLGKVRILEDLPVEEGKAGPGSFVTVRDEGSATENTYWILGEGDHDYGAEVISYRAPLGRALTGGKVGDVVDYDAQDGTRRLRILSVIPRRPEGPP
jgi:transcription elongation factor GreA